MVNESATALRAQAMPTRMPPIMTTIFGPKRSTNQPSTGTSQVSVSTKMLKATWIAARPHWYLASIGKTNSVQPYCKLAIITMQAVPIPNCSHRNPDARAVPVVAVLDMFLPLVWYYGAAGATAGVQPQVIV